MVSAFACVGLSSTDCNDDHMSLDVMEALLENLYSSSGRGHQKACVEQPDQTSHTATAAHNTAKSSDGKNNKLSRIDAARQSVRNSKRVKYNKLKEKSAAGKNIDLGMGSSLADRLNTDVFSYDDEITSSSVPDKSVCIELLINLLLNLFDQ